MNITTYLFSTVKVWVAQVCLILFDPKDYSPPDHLYPWNSPGTNTGVSSHSFSRVSSQLRDWTGVSHIAGRFLNVWATREALLLLLVYGCLIVPCHHLEKTYLSSQSFHHCQKSTGHVSVGQQLLNSLCWSIDLLVSWLLEQCDLC